MSKHRLTMRRAKWNMLERNSLKIFSSEYYYCFLWFYTRVLWLCVGLQIWLRVEPLKHNTIFFVLRSFVFLLVLIVSIFLASQISFAKFNTFFYPSIHRCRFVFRPCIYMHCAVMALDSINVNIYRVGSSIIH